MNSFGPVVLVSSPNEDSIKQFQSKLVYFYDDLITIRTTSENNTFSLSMFCALDFIDYKYLRQLMPKDFKCAMSKGMILRNPNFMNLEVYSRLMIDTEEYDAVLNKSNEFRTLIRQYVCPCMIITFTQIDVQQTYLKNCKYENVFQKSIESPLIACAFIYNSDLDKLPRLRFRRFIPEYSERFRTDSPMTQPPNGFPVKEFKKLLFQKEQFEIVQKAANEAKAKIEKPKFANPKLIIIMDQETGTKLVNEIKSVYSNQVLIKDTLDQDQMIIGAIYSSQHVNYNSLWYMIPKEAKRFVSRNPMSKPPQFISQEVFSKLQFTYEEYEELEQSTEIPTDKLVGDTVPPKIIVQVPRESVDDLQIKLMRKFKASHGHIRISKTKLGSCFIGILFKEPLLSMQYVKPNISQYNYAYNADFVSMCPDFVPESCYDELHFNAGLWQSLQDLAEIVTEKQNKHKESKPEKQGSSKEENETEESEHESDVESEAQQVEISENVVVVDFEAYIVTKACTSPSEFGAIRFYNGKPVAAFHALLAATASDLEKMENPQTKLGQQMKFIQRLTGIPAPGTEQYEALNKAGDYEEVKKAFELFCFGGSDDLKQFQSNEISIQCFEEFAADKTRTLVSKGTSLEQKIFGQFFQITERVIDFGFLLGKRKVSIAQQKVYFQNIHSHSRKYKYCPFHDALENKNGVDGTMVHCALDDVWFLADILSAVAEGHTALETEAISNGEQEYEVAEQVGRVVVEGPEEVLQEVLLDALENKWDAELVGNQLCVYSQFEQNQKVEALLNDQCKLRQFRETGQFEEAVRAWFQKRL
ncbi:Conserved_hypothetical protein [Hexamita inflata]|uniref:Uncharacterized protein n=1 Tax=Hexamita inflata TaxID=28002 RepID=A0AA86UJ30_9EUKA|nr:Conserved hypothetical protein [Hexamita inflata]